MKSSILVLALISLINPSFSKHQSNNELALELIDNICGDTWCEGDFNTGFMISNLIRKSLKRQWQPI